MTIFKNSIDKKFLCNLQKWFLWVNSVHFKEITVTNFRFKNFVWLKNKLFPCVFLKLWSHTSDIYELCNVLWFHYHLLQIQYVLY